MRRFWSLPIEWFVLTIPLLLTVCGIVTIYTITFAEHGRGLAVSQSVYALIGVLFLLVFMFTDYRALKSYIWPLFIFGIALLALLLPVISKHLPFAVNVFGATRWLDFGFFQLQPSEIFKLIGIIIASAILSGHIGQIRWKAILQFAFISVIPLGMILAQPNLGTTAVLFIIFMSIFLSAKPSRRLLLTIFALLVIAAPLLWFNLKPYQRTRIATFTNQSSDPRGRDYNVNQSLITVGSGGLKGQGFGQGSQTALNFLPVAHSDFIFAGWAEATGFIGSAALLLLYGLLIWRILGIARDTDEPFGQLIAVGVATKFFFQLVVHVGMNTGMLPVTGIPLPFMSFGGTALIVDLASIGLLESIYIRHKKLVFNK